MVAVAVLIVVKWSVLQQCSALVGLATVATLCVLTWRACWLWPHTWYIGWRFYKDNKLDISRGSVCFSVGSTVVCVLRPWRMCQLSLPWYTRREGRQGPIKSLKKRRQCIIDWWPWVWHGTNAWYIWPVSIAWHTLKQRSRVCVCISIDSVVYYVVVL